MRLNGFRRGSPISALHYKANSVYIIFTTTFLGTYGKRIGFRILEEDFEEIGIR
jgi:hypothetical protein